MPRQQLVAGLDVGSSQITCVLGKEGPAHNTLEIISVGQKQCPGGIKAGTVVDIDVATDAIKFAIEQAEEKADEIINQLYLVSADCI